MQSDLLAEELISEKHRENKPFRDEDDMVGEHALFSPKIVTLKWGRMEVENLGRGKDFMLWPGGGQDWNWQDSGTSHSQGIQISDCEELVKHGSRIVVLSRGVFSRLRVPEQTVLYLQGRNVETVVAETKKAVKIYNDFAGKGEMVGGLFHSTC